MDQLAILRRSVDTVRRHRALWVVGLLWSLVGGGLGSLANVGGRVNYGFDASDPGPFGRLDPALLLGGIALLCGVLLLLAVVATVLRYVLQVGVYRALDQLETEGKPPTVRGTWRQGWHRRSWRPFLQNLVVDIPFAILAILLLLPLVLPALLIAGGDETRPLGIVVLIGLGLAWLAAMLLASAVLGLLKQLWWRAAVLDDIGFLEAIGQGWRLARGRAGELALMWLLMLGAGIVWGAVSLLVLLLFGGLTALVAGVPAFLLWQATQSWVLPALVLVPVSLLTLALPLLFVSGLYLVFEAAVWNLVYRQLAPAAPAEPPAEPPAGPTEAGEAAPAPPTLDPPAPAALPPPGAA